MSELPAGSVSLEENALAPEPEVETPPPVVEAPAAVENPDEAEPEGVVVNPSGEKLVPLSALAAARQAAREAKAQIEALKPKAEQAEAIAREWQAVQPIIERAKQAANQPPPPQQPMVESVGPLSEQDALDYAKYLDLYKADGTPDVDRAQRIAKLNESVAQRQAQQYVQPLIQHTAASQSRANLEQAATFKGQNGIQVDRGILEQVWNAVPPEMSAQPQIAAVLYRQALAEMVLQGKIKPGTTITAPPPPVVTESLGGGSVTRKEPDRVERGFMQATDMAPKVYEEISSRFKPGERNALE